MLKSLDRLDFTGMPFLNAFFGLIACTALASSPPASTTYNWVIIPPNNWNIDHDDAYGTATYTLAGDVATFDIQPYLLDGTQKQSFTASGYRWHGDGTFRHQDPNRKEIFAVAPSGIMVADFGPNKGGAVGMIAPSSAVDVSSTALTGKRFRGILFKNDSPGEDTEPVGAEYDAMAGGIRGYSFRNIETGEMNTEGSALLTFETPDLSPYGIIKGTLTTSNGQHECVFMVNVIRGKYVVFGISYDTYSGVDILIISFW